MVESQTFFFAKNPKGELKLVSPMHVGGSKLIVKNNKRAFEAEARMEMSWLKIDPEAWEILELILPWPQDEEARDEP